MGRTLTHSNIESAPGELPHLDVDPFSSEFLLGPQRHHATMREAGPIVWLPRYGTAAMARYVDVHAALDDWETFGSARGVGLTDFKLEEPWRPPSIILEADPPLHTRTRSVLSKVLSKSAIEKLRGPFTAHADQLVDELLEQGSFDAIAALAEAFPLRVFPDAVGVTEVGRENLLPYGDMAFNAFGPRNERFEASFANAQKVSAWIVDQCDAAALNEAGFGAQIYAFAQHPQQWSRLRENPKLVRNAVSEVIRFMSPIQTFFRTTTRPTQMSGVPLDAGRKVMLFLASANHDPSHFEHPEKFDIGRANSATQLGFGQGIHKCVGQQLVRLEMEVLLSALAAKIERFELSGEPTWRLNNTLRGLDALPLSLHAG
jgi:cytochrome P450